MYRQEVSCGFSNEVVENIEMTSEEVEAIRNESIANLKDGLKKGYVTQEEYDESMKDMEVA